MSEMDEIRKLRKLLADANRGAETNAHINNSLTKKLQERTAERDALIEAAKAVVERWDQPSWKDTEPTAGVIYRLRNAVEAVTGEETCS